MNTKKIDENCEVYKEDYLELLIYCFSDVTREHWEREWQRRLTDKQDIFATLDELDKIACTLTIFNKDIMVNGNAIYMYGVGAVASALKYRKCGHIRALIIKSLYYMMNQKVAYSFLAPFSYEFYEKFGYKLCFERYNIELLISDLESFKNRGSFHIGNKVIYNELNNFYEDISKNHNGICIRESSDWEYIIDENEGVRCIVHKDIKDKIDGYIIYSIKGNKIQVREMIHNNKIALESLLSFIYTNKEIVDEVVITTYDKDVIIDLLKNPRVKVFYIPGNMGRVVNFEEAIKVYNFIGSGDINIRVIDEVCCWNNKTFNIVFEDGKVTSCKESANTSDIEIDIRELSQLLLGFRTLFDLIYLEKALIFDKSILKYFSHKRSSVQIYDLF